MRRRSNYVRVSSHILPCVLYAVMDARAFDNLPHRVDPHIKHSIPTVHLWWSPTSSMGIHTVHLWWTPTSSMGIHTVHLWWSPTSSTVFPQCTCGGAHIKHGYSHSATVTEAERLAVTICSLTSAISQQDFGSKIQAGSYIVQEVRVRLALAML